MIRCALLFVLFCLVTGAHAVQVFPPPPSTHAVNPANIPVRTNARAVNPDRYTVKAEGGGIKIEDKYTGEVVTNTSRQGSYAEVATQILELCVGKFKNVALCAIGATVLPCVASSVTTGKFTCSPDGSPVLPDNPGTPRLTSLCKSPYPSGGYSFPSLGGERSCFHNTLCNYNYGGTVNSSGTTCTVKGAIHTRVSHDSVGDYGRNCPDGTIRTTCPGVNKEVTQAEAEESTATWAAEGAGDTAETGVPQVGNFTSADWVAESIKQGAAEDWADFGQAVATVPAVVPMGYGYATQTTGGVTTTVPYQDWAIIPADRDYVELNPDGSTDLRPSESRPQYGFASPSTDAAYKVYQWTPYGWRNESGEAVPNPMTMPTQDDYTSRLAMLAARSSGSPFSYISTNTGKKVTVYPDGSIDLDSDGDLDTDGTTPDPEGGIDTDTQTTPSVKLPDYCKDFPTRVGCVELGQPAQPERPDDEVVELELQTQDLGLPVGCPEPIPTIDGLPDITFDHICPMVEEVVRPIVVASAALFGALLIIGFVRQ